MVLVETVGAGQAQVEWPPGDTVVLVEAPTMGDEVQALNAGLMEIADIIVVNKADRPEARQTVRALQSVRKDVRLGAGTAWVCRRPVGSSLFCRLRP
jgi:LAO/AO transport system kinase